MPKGSRFRRLLATCALGLSFQAHAVGDVVEEILVTGSYIKRSSFDSSSPLDILDQNDIAKSGATTFAQLFQNLPYNLGSENWPDTTRSGFTTGMESINLRGLGLNSTLVLVNGRRQAEAPQLNSDGIAFVDIASLVPTIAIERVEVLKDGAAALYGSDAISGVVNFITRDEFEGVDLSVEYQTLEEYDAKGGDRARDLLVQGMVGVANDRGNLVVAASLLERNRVPFNQVDFAYGTGISSFGSPGTFLTTRATGESDVDYLARVQAFEATTHVVSPVNPAAPFGSGADFDCLNVPAANGSRPTTFLRGTGVGFPGSEACVHDFLQNQSLIDEERRINLWAKFDYVLDAESDLELYGEFHVARNSVHRANSSSQPLLVFPTVPVDNPGLRNDFYQRGLGGAELVDDAAAQALGFADAVAAAQANPLVGPMLFQGRPYSDVTQIYTDGDGRLDNSGDINRDKTHFVVGLRGNLPLDTWTFDLAGTWSQHGYNGYTHYDVTHTTLGNSLAGYGGRNCNPATNDPGVGPCYYYNPYGSAYLAEPSDVGPNGLYNTDEVYSYMHIPATGTNIQEIWVLEGVVSGSIADLRSGLVGLAVGLQLRDQSYSSNPSGAAQNFEFLASAGEQAFSVNRDVWASFAELLVPVSDPGSALGAMEISAAVRYEDYGGDAGSTTDPKIALLWMPMDELSLRASFQTSFKAPGLAQFGGASSTPAFVQSDPLDPTSTPTFLTSVAVGNPDLEPEEADVFNAGFSWQPDGILDGLRVSVDYWSFEFSNAIRKESGIAVIAAYAAEFNAGILDGPASRKLTLNPDGTLTGLRSDFINTASLDSNGVDVSIGFQLSLDDLGMLDLFWNSSHVQEFEFVEIEGGPRIDGLGKRNFGTIGAPAPRWRGNWGADWLMGNHAANITFRYTDDYKMSRTPSAVIAQFNSRSPSPNIDDHLTIDLQYSYRIEEVFGTPGPTITLGVINLTNEEPPSIDDGLGYDSKLHDPRGRVLYGRMSISL